MMSRRGLFLWLAILKMAKMIENGKTKDIITNLRSIGCILLRLLTFNEHHSPLSLVEFIMSTKVKILIMF